MSFEIMSMDIILDMSPSEKVVQLSLVWYSFPLKADSSIIFQQTWISSSVPNFLTRVMFTLASLSRTSYLAFSNSTEPTTRKS